ncbi:MAG: hypothetical protein ACE5IM_11710, partial [Nitrospinota bacterium]
MTKDRRPRRRSAMEGRLVALGARLVERDGWWQPEAYTAADEEVGAVRAGVGLFDLSPLSKLDVRALDPAAVWPKVFPGEEVPAANEIRPVALAGRAALAVRLNPERFFLTAPPGAGPEMEAALREAAAAAAGAGGAGGACVGVTDVTSGFASVEVAGPAAAAVLRKLCPAVPPGEDRRAVQGPVAGVLAVICRVDGAPGEGGGGAALPAYRRHVSRERGR